MAEITVGVADGDEYEVTITERGSSTSHRVTADAETLERLAVGRSPSGVIEASFRFLLDREPKEAILRTFDLPIIGRYFPDYEAVLGSYLAER
jgi:hypothetical protein